MQKKIINYKFKKFNTYNNKELIAASRVIKSGNLSGFIASKKQGLAGGYFVEKFERKVEKFFKVKHAILVNSWSTGLTCAVGALGIEPGDEIILPTWTMTACSAAILHWNAIPVFADIDPDSFCISIKSIKKLITKKTKAIMVVDIFGMPANYSELKKVSKKHNLKIICDSAQSPGALYYGVHSATIGDIGGYSLNYHKHIHTGEGGILVTNSSTYAKRLRLLRNHAEAIMSKSSSKKNLINMIGNNFRMGEIEAAIGIEQLKKLNNIIKKRIKISNLIISKLNKLPFLKLPKNYKNIKNVFYNIPILLELNKIGHSRKKIKEELDKTGLQGLAEGYVNLHKQPIFQKKICYGSKGYPWKPHNTSIKYSKNNCLVAEKYHNELLLAFQGIALYELSKKNINDIYKAFEFVWKKLKII